ncbi:transcription initiation factor TFIID subunit 4-like [Leopardus geoffroyi]|uniref:transcription initiation factor TFIID subunit 4-like n=1 Tax=Leopardus geoffroyi TaxID=46844 RepID=UPI001E25EE27|nr:transcription initiation factor TFIID subunit 4-like [Leopardus geoffroyi]
MPCGHLFGPHEGLPQVWSMPEGYCPSGPRSPPSPATAARAHTPRTPVSLLPPAPTPAGRADPGLTCELRSGRGPVAGAVPGASRAGPPERSALPAASSSSLSPAGPPAARRLRFPPQQPAGRHRGARGGARLRRPLPLLPAADLALAGSGSGIPGRGGRRGARLPRAPSRAQPLSGGRGGAWLAARGRHGLGARGDGGGVGPGAAGGGAAADTGTDAGAAARPLAMAPERAGGRFAPPLRAAVTAGRAPSPPLPPPRPPARAATCGPPSRMLARGIALRLPPAAPLCPAAAALGLPCALPFAAGLGEGQSKGSTGLARAVCRQSNGSPGVAFLQVVEDIWKTRRGF